jgi:predicted signal transduction protein with EAL and GGDEF domain
VKDVVQQQDAAGQNEPTGITSTLRALSTHASATAPREQAPRAHTALLVCTDGAAEKWGPRWLRQCGIEALVCSDFETALKAVRSTSPDVIIVDASMHDRGGRSILAALRAEPELDAPIIALCANARDVGAALDDNVFDIVRKPYEWRVVALRALHAVTLRRLEGDLSRARESLAGALGVADEARRQLRSRESFEPLTGLPNRKKFGELLKRTTAAANRAGKQVAVFVIGFNRFGLVVEAMGQERADLVLTEIGRTLDLCLLDLSSAHAATAGFHTAAAASIDHARFALMLTCSGSDDELSSLQRRLVERLSQPVRIEGQTVFLSACVGVAIHPQDAADADTLLQRADNAMRDAQSRGGGFRFYSVATDAAAARKLKLEHMLHEALATGTLTVVYQPIVDTALHRTTSAEALVRWPQAEGTSIAPAEFVPIAEEAGLMDQIGEHVLEHACRQLAERRAAGHRLSRICVNVSRAQLMGPSLAATVARCLREHALDPGSLELELSERGVLCGNKDVITQLEGLKRLGVRLSLDDFGTGESAIVYLRELPIDVIKIDQSYVQAVNDNGRDAAIVSAIVALGRQLGLKVVAEGVETAEQLATIERLGCDEHQGFFVSQPLGPQDFAAFLEREGQRRA